MSEQNKSNFQAFGAGLLGFVVVMAIGGGAMMVHSSQQTKAGASPVAAATPIDLGSSMPRPALSSTMVQKEHRADSPAPLMGEESESSGAGASSTRIDDPAESARSGSDPQASSRLVVTQHLDKSGNGSSATAVVKNALAPEKDARAAGKKAAAKLDPRGGGSAAVASVHYGVTSRSELMGRAAGPVYNFKGGAKVGGKGNSAVAGQISGDVAARVAEIKRQLEIAGLPADQRAKLLKDLEAANKDIADSEKPAQ